MLNKQLDYYYKILGLQPGAKQAEVKSVYRHWAKYYHPDRNSSPDAEVMYKEIRAAYEALIDLDLTSETVTDSMHDYPNWTESAADTKSRYTDSARDYSDWTTSSSKSKTPNTDYFEETINADDSKNKLIAIVFFSIIFLIGSVVFFFSFANILITVYQTSYYKKAQAKVVSFQTTGRMFDKEIPVIVYEIEGNFYLARDRLNDKLGIRIGTPVSIRYNPENPKEYVVASNQSGNGIVSLFWSFGMLALSLFILAREIELFADFRVFIFNFIWGALGLGSYLYMGNEAGGFNPFAMVYDTLWSLIPCLILGSFIGYLISCYMKNKTAEK